MRFPVQYGSYDLRSFVLVCIFSSTTQDRGNCVIGILFIFKYLLKETYMSNSFAAIFGLGNQELLLISCFILFFGFVIWSIIDLLSNNEYSILVKLIWMGAILFLPVFGTLFYLYYGRSKKHLPKNS